LGVLDRFRKGNDAAIGDGVSVRRLKGSYPFILSTEVAEEYPVLSPYAFVRIVKVPKLGEGHHYFVDEMPLNQREREAYRKIMGILSKELEPAEKEDTPVDEYVYKMAEKVAYKYRRSLGKFTERSWKKIFYYVVKELAGYGPLHVMFLDPNIEDISCNGINRPIYVWHGKLDIKKMNPLLLTMPDNNYWAVGTRVANAFSVGKKLEQK
jgi:flagellar protein FlaI